MFVTFMLHRSTGIGTGRWRPRSHRLSSPTRNSAKTKKTNVACIKTVEPTGYPVLSPPRSADTLKLLVGPTALQHYYSTVAPRTMSNRKHGQKSERYNTVTVTAPLCITNDRTPEYILTIYNANRV